MLGAVASIDKRLETMIAGFNEMLDHLVAHGTIQEQILEAVSAEPGEGENPVVAALRQLAAVIEENTRAVEAMPDRITRVIMAGLADIIEDRS